VTRSSKLHMICVSSNNNRHLAPKTLTPLAYFPKTLDQIWERLSTLFQEYSRAKPAWHIGWPLSHIQRRN